MVSVRKAGLADVEGICSLLDEQNEFHVGLMPSVFQLSATNTSRVVETLRAEDATFLVAEMDGDLVGLVELRINQTKDLPVLVQQIYVYVQEAIVNEKYRGQGIGSLLMETARAWARERGARSLRTSVLPNNENARSFYKKHGFTDYMVSITSAV